MAHRKASAVAIALVITAVASAGCLGGSRDKAAPPTRTPPRFLAQAQDTAAPPPTSEAEATAAAAATLAAAPVPAEAITISRPADTLLPPDPNAVILQFTRIEPSPWQPEILGQMQPHFSLQASGLGVFTSPFGDSHSGWYQTVITPTYGLAMVKLLLDDIDIVDLAARHGIAEAEYVTNPDGSPARTQVLGVIYAHALGKEGRLVIPEQLMEEPPPGPDHDRLARLHALVLALEVWKQGLVHDFSPDIKMAVGSVLGWWSDVRMPYSPTSAVAYGTRARARVPSDAPVADWPLDAPSLAAAFDADYGDDPKELLLRGDQLSLVLTAARQRPRSFWGPLWRQGAPDRYLVGLRVAVPGSNQSVLAYSYELPRRGIGLGTATPAP